MRISVILKFYINLSSLDYLFDKNYDNKYVYEVVNYI